MRTRGHVRRSIFASIIVFTFYTLYPLFAIPGVKETEWRRLDPVTLFEPGTVLFDTDQDSVIDQIRVSIVVPDNPSATHAVCAANIAARLGYEAAALDLDWVLPVSKVPVLSTDPVIAIDVPLDAFGTGFQHDHAMPLPRLAPGQGRLSFVGADRFPRYGAISIQGADDSGLIAASNFLTGRLPNLWDVNGNTFIDVMKKFRSFMDQRSYQYDAVSFESVDVDMRRPGIVRLAVRIDLGEEEAFDRVVLSFQGKVTSEVDADLLGLTDLEFELVHTITLSISQGEKYKKIVLTPEKEWAPPSAGKPSSTPDLDFSLSQFFTYKGIYEDTNGDFIPDHVPVYLSIALTGDANDAANVAARIGLESGGIRLPLARVAGVDEKPERYGFPLFFGRHHHQIGELGEHKRWINASVIDDAGCIQFVRDNLPERNCIVISADTQEGMTAISDYVSKRMPYLWEYGEGNFRLEDIEEEVRRFFQVRKAPGQVALSMVKIDEWLDRLNGSSIEEVSIELSAEKTPPDLEKSVKDIVVKHLPDASAEVKLHRTGFGTGQSVIEEEFEIPWEVDDVRKVLRSDVLPKILPDSRVRLRIRVSESPEIRARLEAEILDELKTKGIPEDAADVTVLCAYKQGYSWLHDEILPQIKKKRVGRIDITYHTLNDSKEIRWQSIAANTRWLQEIYPIDTILARELGIPDTVITFIPTLKKDPIYAVKVLDRRGRLIFEDTFSPTYTVRPLIDLFAEYDSVRVTTGWIRAEIDEEPVVDRRIITDTEKFWDHLQRQTFRQIVDYVMDVQDGRPASEHAPYFDEFRVDLELSEPDYRVGVDEEVISTLEALHEDILFETLVLFRLIGGRYDAGPMGYPGRILPIIRSCEDGSPGYAKIHFTGKNRARPRLLMTVKERNEEPFRMEYDLSVVQLPDPKLTGLWVKSGEEGMAQIMFEVSATDSIDRYEEFKLRASENTIDRTFIPIGRLTRMVEMLGKLHQDGLFEDALSYDRVNQLLFRVMLADSTEYYQSVALPKSRHPRITDRPVLDDQAFSYDGNRLVQWKSPISPAESHRIMARLNTFPGVTVYYMATSFLGRDVFAVDCLSPSRGTFLSRAKMTALKPTLLLTGRVHGNEVSSTSHLLRLIELCGTDSVYQRYLRGANLIVYPIVNPDGAQTAYEMQKMNPDFMLHAGRFGALGEDVRSRGERDNRYPEAGMVERLREVWLPDIYVDCHGVPSHEWVQLFAGYSAWVRGRNPGPRSYWLPRGWYITGFSWLEDKDHPEYVEAHKAITDAVIASVNSQPEVSAMNERLYRRYVKYGRQDGENYREYFYDGIQLEARLRGRKVEGKESTSPKITYFSATTEAADETARQDWMELVCKAGLAHTTAMLEYLANGENRIQEKAKEYEDGIVRSRFRRRPVLPTK